MFAARSCNLIAASALALTVQALPALAQGEPDAKFQNADDFALELFAPTAPAFVALGMSPRRMADPGAFRDVEIDFANLSASGGYKLGAAVSGLPYWWGHRDITLKQYQDKTTLLERILARTEASLAAAYVNTKYADYYNIGIGVQSQLLDAQDHRLDPASYTCLTQAWETYRKPANEAANDAVLQLLLTNPDATEAQMKAARDEALAQYSPEGFEHARRGCRVAAGQRALGRVSWMVGFGINTRTGDTSFDGLRYDGGAVWTTWRQPLVKDGFLSFELFSQYRFDGSLDVPKQAATFLVTGDEFTAGSGLALERNNWKLDGALSYVRQSYSNAPLADDDYLVGVVRAAVKIRKGLWLQASGGDTSGRAFKNEPFFSFNIKFNWDELRRG